MEIFALIVILFANGKPIDFEPIGLTDTLSHCQEAGKEVAAKIEKTPPPAGTTAVAVCFKAVK